jgi:hypothetical protein
MSGHDPELAVLELRDSVAWAAGVGYQRRISSEILRQRAIQLRELPGPTAHAVQTELRRMADLIEQG